MIINSKAVSLIEAATMLGKTEQEVLRLCQHGYLEQNTPDNGKTRISLNSIQKYALRSEIELQPVLKPVVERSGSLTIAETATKLCCKSETTVHRLIQSGQLQAYMEAGTYKVNADSLRNYILGA